MRTEKELDHLETLIPEMFASVTKKAYIDALSRGNSVTEVVDGKLVLTAPDGTRTFIRDAKPMVKVPRNA
jgi:hypothetical protein